MASPAETQTPVTSNLISSTILERFFNKIKHYRGVATRFEKHDANFLAAVKLAALRIWMRFNESMT